MRTLYETDEYPGIIQLLKFFLKSPYCTIEEFSKSGEVMRPQMLTASKTLSGRSKKALSLLERIEYPKLVSDYFQLPEEKIVFYEAYLQAAMIMACLRTIHFELLQDEASQSKEFIDALGDIWQLCEQSGNITIFEEKVRDCFKNAASFTDFIEFLQRTILPEGRTFSDASRRNAIRFVLEEFEKPESRYDKEFLAIYLMGTAMQSKWIDIETTYKHFDHLVATIQETLKVFHQLITHSPETLTYSEKRRILLRELTNLFSEPFPPPGQ